MRFLFGILVGGGLTLLVATAVDAPTNPIVERAAAGWHQLIELTSRALFPARSAAETAAERPVSVEPAHSDTSAAAGSIASASPSRPLPAEQDDQAEPAVQADADDPAAAPMPDGELTAAAGADVDSLVAAADRVLEGLGRREVTERPASMVPADPETGTVADVGERMPVIEDVTAPGMPGFRRQAAAGDDLAGVWSPFHSERSAEGFARHLSDQFQYPFSVERIGPGAYQVVFSYTDAAERDALLAEIAEVTGP